ncbi:MAG: hypothetical protein WCO55_00800 [Candidatus Falkowbacteria bacterium]
MKLRTGLVALTAILIVSALVFVIGVSLLARSLGESRLSLDAQESERARVLANACAEHALATLLASSTYAGNELLPLDNYNCYIGAVGGSGNTNRVVNASSTVSYYTRRVQVNVSQLTPTLTISSWREVP